MRPSYSGRDTSQAGAQLHPRLGAEPRLLALFALGADGTCRGGCWVLLGASLPASAHEVPTMLPLQVQQLKISPDVAKGPGQKGSVSLVEAE